MRPPATFADLANVPDTMVGQIIDGALVVHPWPALPHVQTTSNVGGDINGRFGRSRAPGGWWIVDKPEVHLSADALVPDLAGWKRERLATLSQEAFLTIAPDWVLEVLSPSTASIDRVSKARIYAREGVRWLWFIDPIARTIEVNRLESGRWLQVAAFTAGEPLRAEPFDAEEFDTTDWFTSSP